MGVTRSLHLFYELRLPQDYHPRQHQLFRPICPPLPPPICVTLPLPLSLSPSIANTHDNTGGNSKDGDNIDRNVRRGERKNPLCLTFFFFTHLPHHPSHLNSLPSHYIASSFLATPLHITLHAHLHSHISLQHLSFNIPPSQHPSPLLSSTSPTCPSHLTYSIPASLKSPMSPLTLTSPPMDCHVTPVPSIVRHYPVSPVGL